MKTVTISFKNSRGKNETATFDIYPKVEKAAALQAGIAQGETFYYIRTA